MSVAAAYNFSVDRGSDWSKVLTVSDNNGDPVPVTDIFTTDISIGGTTSPSVTAASLTYVSTDLWTSNGSASVPGSGTWIRVRRASGAWEVTKWVNGSQVTGYWTSDSNPNHPAWVESWTAEDDATGEPEVDSDGMFFEGSISLQERGPDIIPFEFTTVGDGTDGQVTVSLSRSYTRSLSSGGAYRFDWFMYRGRKRLRLVAGRVTAQGSSTGTATGIPVPAFGGSPTVNWGSIGGTLANQTDLQAALDAAGGGSNSVTSTTTSDGTADLLLLNVETAAFEATGNAAFQGSVEFQTTDYAYGTGAAAAHRTALGSGATGDALFTAATTSAARTVIGSGATGDALFTAATPSAAKGVLGVLTATAAGTTAGASATSDVASISIPSPGFWRIEALATWVNASSSSTLISVLFDSAVILPSSSLRIGTANVNTTISAWSIVTSTLVAAIGTTANTGGSEYNSTAFGLIRTTGPSVVTLRIANTAATGTSTLVQGAILATAL